MVPALSSSAVPEYPFTMASFIEGVRTRRSLSQADLARKIGVTQQSVSKWEAGTASPRGEQLAQLNEALDIAPGEWEDLLGGLDDLEPLQAARMKAMVRLFIDEKPKAALEGGIDFNSAMTHVPDHVRQTIIELVTPYLDEDERPEL